MPRNSSSSKLILGLAPAPSVMRLFSRLKGLTNIYSATINPICCLRVGYGKVTVASFQDPSALHPFLSSIRGLLIKVGIGLIAYCVARIVLAAFIALVSQSLPYRVLSVFRPIPFIN